MYLIFWALLIFTAGLRQADGCGTNNVYCVTDTTYKFCFVSGSTTTYVPTSSTLSCSSSQVCSETASTSQSPRNKLGGNPFHSQIIG
ncbi:hypothetical protein NQ318_017583 [Aromia moschata]|uniref:Uncharacterized protein n=1 Tax=Aromia moschata TaxID=1265417 RepID=A0AAV8Z2D6_9CUCU|nr:hypothetical protein NQ318_017583 [Aromia moschata]